MVWVCPRELPVIGSVDTIFTVVCPWDWAWGAMAVPAITIAAITTAVLVAN